ncbi:hypothetical protein KBA73_01010 [Patescibacteria group bacterium]|nr:hypothetical protein [Patescibacteria group bacterium]
MTRWEKLLKTLGFTDSESKLYLVSLEMGEATVQDLAKKASISRVTAYAVIDSLMKSGLMSTIQKGKRRLFLAESPDRLASFMHARMRQMETTLHEVENSLEELRLIQRGEKPIVKLFTGEEGIRVWQQDIINSRPDELIEFDGNFDAMLDVYPSDEHNLKFFDTVDRMNIKRRLIEYVYDGKVMPKGMSSKEQIAVIKPEAGEKKLFCSICVFSNRVSLSTLRGELIYIVIESQDVADTMRAMFDHAWKNVQDKRIS